jgi:hypothetical protein
MPKEQFILRLLIRIKPTEERTIIRSSIKEKIM